jgi:hypothetical protein
VVRGGLGILFPDCSWYVGRPRPAGPKIANYEEDQLLGFGLPGAHLALAYRHTRDGDLVAVLTIGQEVAHDDLIGARHDGVAGYLDRRFAVRRGGAANGVRAVGSAPSQLDVVGPQVSDVGVEFLGAGGKRREQKK